MERLSIAGNMKKDGLEQDGFERRGVYEEPRLTEIVQMYEEAGFEVVVLDYKAGGGEHCNACLDDVDAKNRYKVVYTRKRK